MAYGMGSIGTGRSKPFPGVLVNMKAIVSTARVLIESEPDWAGGSNSSQSYMLLERF